MLPSFEETNNPGYDEAFKTSDAKQSLSLFKALGSSLGKLFGNTPKENPYSLYSPEQQEAIREISVKVDEFLDKNMISTVCDLRTNGYPLNQKQEKIFEQKMNEKSSGQEAFQFLTELIRQGNVIEDRYLINALFFDQAQAQRVTESLETSPNEQNRQAASEALKSFYPELFEIYMEKMKDTDFTDKLFPKWKQLSEDLAYGRVQFSEEYPGDKAFEDMIARPLYRFSYHELLFRNIGTSEYNEVIANLKKIHVSSNDTSYYKYHEPHALKVKSMIEYLDSKREIFLKTELTSLVDKTRKLFSTQSLTQKTIEAAIRTAKKVDLTKLPQTAQTLFNEIKTVYEQIDYKCLNEEDRYTLKTVQEKRLPETLQAYFSIHEDYRTTLKNSAGQNAEDLMIVALKDMKEVLDSLAHAQQEEKLKDLSVQSRLTRDMKKGF